MEDPDVGGGDRKRRRRNAFGPNSAEAKLVTQVAQAYFVAENLELIHEGVNQIILSVETEESKDGIKSSPSQFISKSASNSDDKDQKEITVSCVPLDSVNQFSEELLVEPERDISI